MRTATVVRQSRLAGDDQGTTGVWTCDNGPTYRTMELPYRGNAQDISCIPEGVYILKWQWSEKHGCNLYHFQNVTGRTVVELHSFNLAGDVSKGFVAQSLGCMAPGRAVAMFPPGVAPAGPRPQLWVTQSKDALGELEQQYRDPVTGDQVDIQVTISRAA